MSEYTPEDIPESKEVIDECLLRMYGNLRLVNETYPKVDELLVEIDRWRILKDVPQSD